MVITTKYRPGQKVEIVISGQPAVVDFLEVHTSYVLYKVNWWNSDSLFHNCFEEYELTSIKEENLILLCGKNENINASR